MDHRGSSRSPMVINTQTLVNSYCTPVPMYREELWPKRKTFEHSFSDLKNLVRRLLNAFRVFVRVCLVFVLGGYFVNRNFIIPLEIRSRFFELLLTLTCLI